MKEHIEYMTFLLETFSLSFLYWSDNILGTEKKETPTIDSLPITSESAPEIANKEHKELVVLP